MPAVLRNWAARLRAFINPRWRLTIGIIAICAGALAFTSCARGVDRDSRTSSVSQPRGLARLVPSSTLMAGFPRFSNPFASRDESSSLPASEVACRKRLRKLGVTWTDLAPINQGNACRIAYPVRVTRLPGNVDMKPAATLSCEMALAFAGWTKNELSSAARWRYFSGVKTIHQGSSYSCRNIRGSGGVASEHSRGNALDVMRIELRNGKDIDVRRPGLFAFRERGLLNSVRKGGCAYFGTVLGPGYDADHADHFHFDVKKRKNGYVACR